MNPKLDLDTETTANDQKLRPQPYKSINLNATMPSTNMVQDSTVKDESTLLLMNERKCCRICLDEEEEDEANDTDPMIAPCMCKGSSKWVHRKCLDSWRMNEPDRAFAQCTECHYTYHLIASNQQSSFTALSTTWPDHPLQQQQQPSPSSFWNQPRMKFCFFVSRDVCSITILMQLVIAGLGYIIMLLDTNQHWDLTHLLLNPNSDCHPATSNDSTTTFWCRHNELAVYYLFGILSLLVIVGTIGSIIFCRNGCSFHNYDHVDDVYESYDDHNNNKSTTAIMTKAAPYNSAIPVSNFLDMERGMQRSNDLGVEAYHPQLPVQTKNHTSYRYQRRSTEYYRRQRQIRHDQSRYNNQGWYNNICCGISSSSGNANGRTSTASTCSDRCTTTNHICFYTNSCPCDDPNNSCCDDCTDTNDRGSGSSSTNDDCCCCGCCNCPDHHHISSTSTSSHDCNCGDGDNNPLAILLFLLLLFFVILAMIGLFLLLVIGVIVCQRIVQRHIFLLQKQTLVQEFQVADLSTLHETNSALNTVEQSSDTFITNRFTDRLVLLPETLHLNDVQRLQKLGLLNVKDGKKRKAMMR